MLAALEGMIAELRQIGVPVSLAERIDAMQSLRHLPLGDRPTVKAALRAVLVKTPPSPRTPRPARPTPGRRNPARTVKGSRAD